VNRNLSSTVTVIAVLSILVFGGCYEPTPPPELIAELPSPSVVPLTQYRIIGTSVRGRPLLCTVLGEGQDVAFILATIHGDESAGTSLVRGLAEHLQQNQELLRGRKVLLLPIANPDGMAMRTRSNAHGVDLNRNFRTANRIDSPEFGLRALSEPEAQAIEGVIREYAPARIVSIHQRAYDNPACIDYDGPASLLASRMAQYCDLPVQKLGAKPGSLGSYAGLTLAIPIITFELPSDADRLSQQALWERYGNALIAAVVYPHRIE
jgi:protein MpaA